GRHLDRNARRVVPQAFEVVMLARGMQKHVDDEVAVIEQRPLTAACALGRERTQPVLLETGLDRVGDRIDLAIGATGEHELIIADEHNWRTSSSTGSRPFFSSARASALIAPSRPSSFMCTVATGGASARLRDSGAFVVFALFLLAMLGASFLSRSSGPD